MEKSEKFKDELLSFQQGAFGELAYKEIGRSIPETFKMGRDAQLQLASVERTLFTDMEEKESGNYIVSGFNKQVTELDFTAFSLAAAQLLYNQSYQSGNEETNSGLKTTIAKRISKATGYTQYKGEIVTSLNNLCRLAYGVDSPDARQRKAMITLIKTLEDTPVVIKYPNGDKLESKLCSALNKYTRKEDGAIFYHLILNPIFCSNVKRNFGELPQNITKRLSVATKKKTTAQYRLLTLLSIQKKDVVFIRSIDELLKELSLIDAYKKDKGRVEKQLLATFETMKDVKILDRYELDYITIRGRKSISKVFFYLNDRETFLSEEINEV